MKIGYPCINRSVGCSAGRAFRLRSFSEPRFLETVENNLSCLLKILEYNLDRGIFFFRISSDLIPFASHPVCSLDWQSRFTALFRKIGRFIRREGVRISMHPDQFVLLNALEKRIVDQSVRELVYHAEVLDLMELDDAAKIQIHVGAAYGDKEKGAERFTEVYGTLDSSVRDRLVIENDHRIYSAADCIRISQRTGIPVLLDTFHHQLNGNGESLSEALRRCAETWTRIDGPLMVDYSSQEPGARDGAHAKSIDLENFRRFLQLARTVGVEMDVMLEIKDKEKSALKALKTIEASG